MIVTMHAQIGSFLVERLGRKKGFDLYTQVCLSLQLVQWYFFHSFKNSIISFGIQPPLPYSGKVQKPIRVAMCDLFYLYIRQFDTVQEVNAHFVGAKWVIHRKHNIVYTKGVNGHL